jgi:tRNA(Ile)-lysidine synthase
MFRRTKKALVAVSGGPDSLACLFILKALGEELGFEVAAGHFDHQLRPDSKAAMEAVRALCDGQGIECVTGEGDVAGVARQQKQGVEETARTMRYQFLAFLAEKVEADCIATGHTADDQAETVLMRIIRGSGVRGIRGMLPVSGVPGSDAQRLVRPLLETPRQATLSICQELGLTPVDDPSNADPRFTRNRLRSSTLGVLRELNPGIRAALVGLAESARQAFEPVERSSFAVQPRVRGPVGAIFATAGLRELQAEALGLVIEREASFYHLEPETSRTRLQNLTNVLRSGAGAVSFGDTVVEASCGSTRIGPLLRPVEDLPVTILNVPGDTRVGPWRAEVRTDPLEPTAELPVVALGSSETRGALRLRSLATGERLRYRGCDRKVSDLLVNEKVPRWERAGMLVVADADGPVALLGAHRTFARDAREHDLWVRLSVIPPR